MFSVHLKIIVCIHIRTVYIYLLISVTVGTICNDIEDVLIVFNGMPEDGQYAETCWSV
jgi:hypothetical protein